MTPFDITRFSEALLTQKRPSFPKLTQGSPLFTVLHPCLVKNSLAPGEKTKTSTIGNISFERIPASAGCLRGTPAALGRFLSEGSAACFQFDGIGHVKLTKGATPEIAENDLVMKEWLDYALSPELWGTDGKWIRFHKLLEDAFVRHQLLAEGSMPGYYVLTKSAQRLEDFGIVGDLTSDSYALTLPWDFSKTMLDQLLAVLRQEF